MTQPKRKIRIQRLAPLKSYNSYGWDLAKICFDKKCSCEHPVNEDSICVLCGLKSRRV